MLAEGSSVAVFGCGAIGLGVINTAALVGASRIIAIDINNEKESWAKSFGATEFVNSSALKDGQKIQDHLVEITDGGLDFTFDCTGNVSGFLESSLYQKSNRDDPIGSCDAIGPRGLSQRMGCLYCDWCCSRWTRDLHSTVRCVLSCTP